MSRLFVLLAFVCVMAVSAVAETSSDSTSKSSSVMDVLSWPFFHIIQPFFGYVIYPISQPLHYAFSNGVIEKMVDMISFGEKKNIMIYPVTNLKPGTSTMLGADYRHRNMIFDRDYFVTEGHFFANSDFDLRVRYSKQGLFGMPLLGAFNFRLDFNRDDYFIVPMTKEQYIQADSTISFGFRLGFPLTESRNLNASFSMDVKLHDEGLPTTMNDTIFDDSRFLIEDRGLYQNFVEIPVEFALVYDNLDCPFAPSRGTRFTFEGTYVVVGNYDGVDLKSGNYDGSMRRGFIEDGGKNHDYLRMDIILQHYFLLGKTDKYILSAKEARVTRRFYTDFSLDKALRVWRPENVLETLFERRVLAFQYRFIGVWEVEKGGTPFSAYPYLNTRFPMRGYTNSWSAPFVMGLSGEYRWPIDRYVDGVFFNEYSMISDEVNRWSFKRLYNSWGFGVRVRTPDLYLFRVQFGFHGLHGVSLVLTVAPEFK